jgi:hypothetical protein
VVGIASGLVKRETVTLAIVKRATIKYSGVAGHRVVSGIQVGPGDSGTGFNGESSWIEGKILYGN